MYKDENGEYQSFGKMEIIKFYQTKLRGDNLAEYQIYLDCADDGKGGDITNNGKPLKSFNEWINS